MRVKTDVRCEPFFILSDFKLRLIARAYRKLSITVEKRKDLCPICNEELVKLHYLGIRRIVKVKVSVVMFPLSLMIWLMMKVRLIDVKGVAAAMDS